MKILCACEESQSVTIELRKLGHEAYSCDLQECSGGHPEWHIQDDVFNVIKDKVFLVAKNYSFCDEIIVYKWDMLIGFPPCTHLAVSGAAHFEKKRIDGRQQQGIDFFIKLANAPINKIAIENPVGIMSKIYRKPDQIIQPYYFGDQAQKTTCLWLKNLPKLYHSKTIDLFEKNITHVDKGEFYEWVDGKTGKVKKQPLWYVNAFFKNKDGIGKERSKTFPGIAKAMATQWAGACD